MTTTADKADKTGKSQNPAYPDAPATAPGGMSESALVVELVERHGFDIRNAKSLTWPQKIEVVIQNRLAREAEAKADAAATSNWDNDTQPVNPDNHGDYAGESDDVTDMFDDLDDIDAMLADIGLVEAEPERIEPDAAAELVRQMHDTPLPAAHTAEHMVEDMLDRDDDAVLDPEVMFAQMVEARTAEEATQPAPIFIGIPGVRDYIFDGHAGAGPSGAERWAHCTMSLTASRAFLETLSPNQQRVFAGANTAARQGTTAHNAAEVEANFILGRVTEEEVEQTLIELSFMPDEEAEAYDEEMGEYIAEYVDLIKTYAQERGSENVLIEARVEADIPLTDLHEGEVYVIRGSGDAVALPVNVKDQRSLVVGDLKYGNGIDVDVNKNPQIRLYALGVLALLADPETGELPEWLEDVIYHIIQPRLGGIKTWSESIDDLLDWRDEWLAPRLTKALYGADEGATFEPSDVACQFCPARGRCPALTEQRIEAATSLFDAVIEAEFEHGAGALPDATSLTDTRLGEMLAQISGLINLHGDLKEEAQRRLHRGGSVPGWQLVSYTPPRKWTTEAAEALAEVEGVWKDPNLITPTQALKVLKDQEDVLALVNPLIEAPAKRPVIAREGDRRKTWTGTPPEQMFADESAESVSGNETGDSTNE